MNINKILLTGLILIGVVSLSGCTSSPAKSNKPVNYGPYPENYEAIVKSYLGETLFDPYSVKYNVITQPIKAFSRKAPIVGGRPDQYGWYSKVCFNAKNRMGGYVGNTCYKLLLKYNRVIMKFTPNVWHSEEWYR